MMNYFHMDPEEMIIGSPFIIPSHYNTCPLGFENFNQAVEDFVKKEKYNYDKIKLLKPGEYWYVPLLK